MLAGGDYGVSMRSLNNRVWGCKEELELSYQLPCCEMCKLCVCLTRVAYQSSLHPSITSI